MDAHQKKILRDREREMVQRQTELRKLKRKLLSLGGEAVCLQYEPDLDLLLTLGQEYAQPVRRVPGVNSACHLNVGRLFDEKRLAAIVTGWALSEDGIWRQHSWGIDWKGRLVETTLPRTRYFGVYMVRETANEFSAANQ